jgi:PadR family transcriptional regulator, regulatory protein PadR
LPTDIDVLYNIPVARRTELLKGTLDLLILRTLALQPRHGLAIAERIEQITCGAFVVKPGSLFPALHRLEQEGFLVGAWGESDEGYRIKTYRLASAGRRQLERETHQWNRIVLAVGQVLEAE